MRTAKPYSAGLTHSTVGITAKLSCNLPFWPPFNGINADLAPARLERRLRLGTLAPSRLTRLREHGQIDWSRGSIDGLSVPSPRGSGIGAQPDGQRQARLQATHPCRCQKHSAGDLRQRSEPARLQDVLEVRGRDSCDCRLARASP